ncbi:MAG: DUF11 domain-containing protein [Planctomycetes bacterium]|nr:DUF11 domain-containing protein [Planctomycetota bacterium]
MRHVDRKWSVIVAMVALVSLCPACREPAVRTHAFSHSIQNYDAEMASVQVSPVESTSLAKSYALLVATVRDAKGTPLSGKRVEWIIASEQGGVGDIVRVDESGLFLADRGNKWTNTFAETYTNQFDHDLAKAEGGGPDIETLLGKGSTRSKILKGQTWIIVTSPVGGVTRVVAYAPGIRDTSKQRAYATVNWFDARAEFPERTGICKAGSSYRLTCTVRRISDGEPLKGFPVRWSVLETGPDANFLPGKRSSVIAETDNLGISEVMLAQPKAAVGRNTIEIAALFPKTEHTKTAGLWTGRVGSMTITREWCLPVLKMSMSGPDVVHVGDAADYTIEIGNGGKVSAENSQLAVVLPDGVSFLSSHPGGHVRGQEVRWDLETLDAGSQRQIAFAVKMSKEGEGVFRGGLKCKENVGDETSLGVKMVMPHLTISKTGPASLLRGTPATYKVIVKNVGTAPATNVVVTENVPPGFKAKDETQQQVWRIASLGAGKSEEKEYTYVAEVEGKSTHSSVVTADRDIKEEAKVVTIVTAPQLGLTLSGPDRRYVNQKLRYQIVVTNTGTAGASRLVVTNKVPSGFRFLEAGVNGTYDQASNTITWNILGVPAGERASVNAIVKAERIGKFVNSASVSADGGLFAKGEAVTSVEGIAALKIEAYDMYDPVEVGSEADYVVHITNQGTGPATNVTLTGSFPREMEFVSGEGPTTVEGHKSGFVCQPLNNLPPGRKASYRIILRAVSPKDARFECSLTAKELSEPIVEQESTRIVE